MTLAAFVLMPSKSLRRIASEPPAASA